MRIAVVEILLAICKPAEQDRGRCLVPVACGARACSSPTVEHHAQQQLTLLMHSRPAHMSTCCRQVMVHRKEVSNLLMDSRPEDLLPQGIDGSQYNVTATRCSSALLC